MTVHQSKNGRGDGMPFLAPVLKLAAVVLAKAAGEKLGEAVAAELVCQVAKRCPEKAQAVAKRVQDRLDAEEKAKAL